MQKILKLFALLSLAICFGAAAQNAYYTPTGNPQEQTRGTSAAIRAEFNLISSGFSLISSASGINAATDTGVANTYAVTLNANVTQLSKLMQVIMLASNANTGASTINVFNPSGLVGSVSITRRDGTALNANDIVANGIYYLVYDGTKFQMQANPLSGTTTGQLKYIEGASIASASTVNLDAVVGNYVHITGTTTINAITLTSGMFMVVFDGSTTLTNSSTLQLPGGANITTQAGDVAIVWGDTTKTIIAPYVPINPASAVVVPNGYLFGGGLTNNGTTSITIAATQAKDSTNTTTIAALGLNKSISSNYAAGNNNGCMGTGLTAAINTWYNVFAAVISGSNDYFCDTASSGSIAPTHSPAGTTAFRRIGAFKTNGSAQLISFAQRGQMTCWTTPPLDLSTSSTSTGTATLSVPLGVPVVATILLSGSASDNNTNLFTVKSGVTGATEDSVTSVGTVFVGIVQSQVTPSTLGQISYQGQANNGGATINTLCYTDPRIAPAF